MESMTSKLDANFPNVKHSCTHGLGFWKTLQVALSQTPTSLYVIIPAQKPRVTAPRPLVSVKFHGDATFHKAWTLSNTPFHRSQV